MEGKIALEENKTKKSFLRRFWWVLLILVVIPIAFFLLKNGSTNPLEKNPEKNTVTRESKIPVNAVKITAKTDKYPPILHSSDYQQPSPLESPINTAGVEDSPFVKDDHLYFFFTPDASKPANQQLLDEVSGIYEVTLTGSEKPTRVVLQESSKLSLDGCPFVNLKEMWFCSARDGYQGINWFSAKNHDGIWKDWQEIKFPADYKIGELHVHNDILYYHSARSGGKGGNDIWTTKQIDGKWQVPQNLTTVNSSDNELQPFVTEDGGQLWFTRTYKGAPAIYRSLRVNDHWQEPTLIISQFAGEPTLDSQGNIYFVHHYYKDKKMLESDIFVARSK